MVDSPLNLRGIPGWANRVALLIMLAIIAYYLITEHRAHLIAYSGTIFLVVFILMHFFMHTGGYGCGSHGRHGGDDADKEGHAGCGSHGKKDVEHRDHSGHEEINGNLPEGVSDGAKDTAADEHEPGRR